MSSTKNTTEDAREFAQKWLSGKSWSMLARDPEDVADELAGMVIGLADYADRLEKYIAEVTGKTH